MLIDGNPNLTELLFYSIKVQLSIEDLSKEIREIRNAIQKERLLHNLEPDIILASKDPGC